MLMPNDTNPKKSLFYIGGLILRTIKSNNYTLDQIYIYLNQEENVSYQLLILALDWLFILGAISVENGGIIKCI